MNKTTLEDWALHAYADNEICGEQRDEIEQLIRAEPEMAQRVEAWRQQKALLKQAYDGVLSEPLPPALAATLRSGPGARVTTSPWLAMAAAVLLVVVGGLGGWFLRADVATLGGEDIAQQALSAHQVFAAEIRHPVEVDASDKAHLQAWLSKRIGTPFTVPDLAAEGYTLLGGRLLAAGGHPAAQLMYENAGKSRITVFLTAQAKEEETSVRVEEQGNLIACYWKDHKLAFAVAGEMDREPMMRLAKAIYDQFEG
jgi:anti-sigma factor RsiW